MPIRIERGDLPDDEAHRVAAHDFRIDVGLQRGGKLCDADGQRVVLRLGVGDAHGGKQEGEGDTV